MCHSEISTYSTLKLLIWLIKISYIILEFFIVELKGINVISKGCQREGFKLKMMWTVTEEQNKIM